VRSAVGDEKPTMKWSKVNANKTDVPKVCYREQDFQIEFGMPTLVLDIDACLEQFKAHEDECNEAGTELGDSEGRVWIELTRPETNIENELKQSAESKTAPWFPGKGNWGVAGGRVAGVCFVTLLI